MADHPASTEALLARPDLWRAGRIEPNAQTISTGYPTLDCLLADRGWPKAGTRRIVIRPNGYRRIAFAWTCARGTERPGTTLDHVDQSATHSLCPGAEPKSVSTSARYCWCIQKRTRMHCGHSSRPSNRAVAVRHSPGSMNPDSQRQGRASTQARGTARRILDRTVSAERRGAASIDGRTADPDAAGCRRWII